MAPSAGWFGVAVAVIWLVGRLITLLWRPRAELEHLLGQALPVRPRVVVAPLGSTEVYVRWQYDEWRSGSSGRRKLRIPRKHVVRVGHRVLEPDRDANGCWVRGLDPDTLYRIEVLPTGSGSKDRMPAFVCVHTLVHAEEHAPTSGHEPKHTSHESTTRRAADRLESSKSKLHAVGSENGSYSEFNLNGPGNSIRANASRTNGVVDVDGADDDCRHPQERRKLLRELEALHEQRRQDDAARQAPRAELKALEDQKHLLELRRAKLEKQERDVMTRREVQQSRERTLRQRKCDLEVAIRQEDQKCRAQLAALDATMQELIEEGTALSAQVGEIQVQLRDAHTFASQIRSLTDRLRDQAETLSPGGQQSILSALAALVPSDTLEEVRKELELEALQDSAWTERQSVLENEYMAAYQQFETASRALAHETSQAQANARARTRVYAYEYGSQSSFSLPPSGLHSTPSPYMQPAVSAVSAVSAAPSPPPSAPQLHPQRSRQQQPQLHPQSPRLHPQLHPQSPRLHPQLHTQEPPPHMVIPAQTDPGSATAGPLAEEIMSPTAVGNLLPSNLFQEADTDDGLPTHSPPSSRFFSSKWHDHGETAIDVSDERPDMLDGSDGSEIRKSPRKRLGERLLHLGESKSNFVRRLSLFSRRESRENATDEPA